MTNRAVFASLVVAALLVLTLYTWPTTSKLVDTGILQGIFGGILLVGTTVVAIMLYLRPMRLVPKPPDEMTKTERRFVNRLRRSWAKDTRAAGLTRDEPIDDGAIYVEAPHILSIERVALGLRMIVRVVPGISADQFVKAGPGLASAVGADLRVQKIDATNVEVTAVLRDPLAGVREAGRDASARVRIGRKDDGTDAYIDFRQAVHIIIQGLTRSGKSALSYVALGQVAMAPNVRIGGIDPNRVLLSPLAEKFGPDRFVLGADADAAVELLGRYVEIMDERLAWLDRMRVDKIEDFTEDMPVEVIVLEEYAAMLRQAATHDSTSQPKGKTANTIKAHVARLVSEGAKAGIRLVLIIQRADADIVDGATRGQFGTRITMAVDNADAVRMLHPALTPEEAEPVISFPPGRCLLWQDKTTSHMQSDLCTYAEYRARLGMRPATTTELETAHVEHHPAH